MSSSLNAIIDKTQQQLTELDCTIGSLDSTDPSLSKNKDLSSISATFAVINTNLRECSDLTKREPDTNRRDQHQERIKEMRKQYDMLKNQLDVIKTKQNELHKRQLLGDKQKDFNMLYASNTEYLQSEHSTLYTINQMMDELIGTGVKVMNNLREQKDRLIRANENALGGVKGLEAGKKLIKKIGRLVGREKWIFWGGLASIFIVLLYFAFY